MQLIQAKTWPTLEATRESFLFMAHVSNKHKTLNILQLGKAADSWHKKTTELQCQLQAARAAVDQSPENTEPEVKLFLWL